MQAPTATLTPVLSIASIWARRAAKVAMASRSSWTRRIKMASAWRKELWEGPKGLPMRGRVPPGPRATYDDFARSRPGRGGSRPPGLTAVSRGAC